MKKDIQNCRQKQATLTKKREKNTSCGFKKAVKKSKKGGKHPRDKWMSSLLFRRDRFQQTEKPSIRRNRKGEKNETGGEDGLKNHKRGASR